MPRNSIGVRELRQNLSTYLRRVERGETLEVTERGRPVALLAPLPGRTSRIARLVSDGSAQRATRDPSSLRPPQAPRESLVMTASEALAHLRANER